MNFSQEGKMKSSKSSRIFIVTIILIVILSLGYLGKSMLASIGDANNFNNLFNGVRIQYIETEALLDRMSENPDLLLIDVRARDDYEWEHIEESINIPLNELMSYYDDIKKDEEIVTFCDSSDCEYSKIAARRLLKEGFTNVTVLNEGLDGLRTSDLKIARSENNQVIESIFKTESISLEKLEDELQKKSDVILLIDVRSQESYNQHHIDGALWVDQSALDESFQEEFSEKKIIFIIDDFEEAISIGSKLYDLGYFNNQYLLVE